MRPANLVSAIAVASLVLMACDSPRGTTATPTVVATRAPAATCTVKIATELPMQGATMALSRSIVNSVKLALSQVGGMAGDCRIFFLDTAQANDAPNGTPDPATGSTNMQAITIDPSFMAVIGPGNFDVARAQIPITNAAGVLQCDPLDTNPDLTDPAFGALDLRKGRPSDNNYIRVIPKYNDQGAAAARYMRQKLSASKAYVVDDRTMFGKGIADAFEKEFNAGGGTVVGHDVLPGSTAGDNSLVTQASAKKPDAVFFGGMSGTDEARIVSAASQGGLANVPFMGTVNDGSAAVEGSFLNLAGANAKNLYAAVPGSGDPGLQTKFSADYKAAYGADPTPLSALGFACGQVVIDAIARAAVAMPGSAERVAFREAVRKAGVDSNHTYKSVLGDISFDKNGDINQKVLSIYAYDPAGANGKGDWSFKERIDQ